MKEHVGQIASPGVSASPVLKSPDEPTELHLQVGLSSRAGPVRELNEDYAAYHMPDDAAQRRARGSIFLVADGMGGHRAGEIASRDAVTRVVQQYLADDAAEPGESLLRAVRHANRWVYAQARSDPRKEGMGTTLVAAVVRGRHVYVANVGDSRAYVVNQTGITQITQDHSWVEEQVQAGLLSQTQADRHPQRNLITRALGRRPTVEVDLFEGELLPGDALLLCTDGVCGLLSAEQLAGAVRNQPPDLAAAALVTQAGTAGGEDNATALVVEAQGARPAQAEDQKATLATGTRQPRLQWIADWINGPGVLRLGVKRQRVVVVLASLVSFLCLCLALMLLPGVVQSLPAGAVSAPYIAPLRDGRLAGNSPEQTAHYLGYPREEEMASAHQDQVNWADLATADLWPSAPRVFLAGTARSWSCEAGNCAFVVSLAGTDHTVYYSDTSTGPSLTGRKVRVLGSQQSHEPGLMAEFIESRRAWWVWWQPSWRVVYPGNLWHYTVWVYGTVERHPNGLLDTEQAPTLHRGSKVLVRGQWNNGGTRSATLDPEQVYQLQGSHYVPIPNQGIPVPQPTVTLQPTPTG